MFPYLNSWIKGPITSPISNMRIHIVFLAKIYKNVLYVLQDYNTVRTMIVWIDPKMKNYTIDSEKEYGVNCWDITFDRIWSHFDWFAFGHYFGWGMKVTKSLHFFSFFQKL